MKTVNLRTRTLACSLAFVLVAMAGLMPAAAQAVTPVSGTPPALTPVTINDSAGDQYDPHISGDWVSYTSDLSIRYYNFATNTDAAIPMGASARDLLSDISGSKIVFSRVITGVKTTLMVFDAATAAAPIEMDAVSGTTRIGSAIGGNTVAYVDFGIEGHGELIIHDLTTATSVRITNDIAYEANPSVSPDGNVVTWEHCNTSSSNCDIWQAVKTGPVWNVTSLSDAANPEANPDTNGTLVVYDSLRASNGDLFWQPVGGGAEVQLQLPSFEANPNIAGNFIAFESRVTLFSTTDIFVYDIVNNRFFQITDTPLVTEQLNDITLLPNGDLRVVWTTDEDGFDQRNVKGATFSVPAAADTTPPVIVQLPDITANATMPSGATVSFVVNATDDVGVVSLVCTPATGSVFPIGTSPVQCTASDAAGNTDGAGFSIRIKGAPEQIVDLVALAAGTTLPPALRAKLLATLQAALAEPHNVQVACRVLNAFILLVRLQPPNLIPPAKKNQMIADATRIKTVLGCP
jgi:Tol biopolymer transport system component